EMKGDGFERDVVVYGIVVNAHCKAKKYDLAVNKFDEMRVRNVEVSPHIYCSLINGLRFAGVAQA
ncbi:pentatricopeptide repeat-containing protein, partial [Tanacetum coccineum]